MASAVSTTLHTTTAAISMGLPSWSFTLSFALSKLRTRRETRRRFVSGFTHQKPWSRRVPRYVPKSCTTCPSFGFTIWSPAKQTPSTTSTSSSTTSRGRFWARAAIVMPTVDSTSTATSTSSISHPDDASTFFSRNMIPPFGMSE